MGAWLTPGSPLALGSACCTCTCNPPPRCPLGAGRSPHSLSFGQPPRLPVFLAIALQKHCAAGSTRAQSRTVAQQPQSLARVPGASCCTVAAAGLPAALSCGPVRQASVDFHVLTAPSHPPQLLTSPPSAPGALPAARRPAALAAPDASQPGACLVRAPTQGRRAQVPLHGVEARYGGGWATRRARRACAGRPCSAAQRAQSVSDSAPRKQCLRPPNKAAMESNSAELQSKRFGLWCALGLVCLFTPCPVTRRSMRTHTSFIQ